MRILAWILLLSLATPLAHTGAAAAVSVNVQTYGARGDGVTDDTAAIQRAIDAASASGGTVTLPAGTYRLVLPPKDVRVSAIVLRVPSNVAIVGMGASSVLKLDPVPPGQDTAWILATCNPAQAGCPGPTRNVRLENFVIDGSRGRQPIRSDGRESQHMHGVFLVGASDVQIRRLTVREVAGDGIYTYRDNQRVLVEQSTFQRIRRIGINYAGTSHSIARSNTVDDAQWAIKMELDGPAERSVAGNEFRRNVGRNVFGGIAITKSDELHLATHARAADMVIAENDFDITSDKADRIGIIVTGVDRVRVSGNRVSGNLLRGLSVVDDVSGLTVDGNHFTVTPGSPSGSAAGAACIRLSGRDPGTASLRSVTITGNTFTSCRVGVHLARPGRFPVMDVTISGNTFVANPIAGILVDVASAVVNLVIGSNVFRQTPNQVIRR